MRINNFLSLLPNNVVPYALFAASIVLPVVMTPKEQLLCSVSTVMLCQLTLVTLCVGLDLVGKKFGNLSPFSRFLDRPESAYDSAGLPDFSSGSRKCNFAAPAA